MSSTPLLNYAPPPPLHQRRLFRRMALLVVLLACLFSGNWWGPPAFRHAQLLYWQQRCMRYQPPPNQVIYDSQTAGFVAPPLEWSRFYNLYSPPGFNSRGTAFLHEMREHNGAKRLVAIDVELLAFGGRHDLVLFPRVIVPLGILNWPVADWGDGRCGNLPDDSASPFRVFAGSVDPSDPSHLTIRMQQGNEQTYFDGWLANNELEISKREAVTPAK